jgi:hypothetical protein
MSQGNECESGISLMLHLTRKDTLALDIEKEKLFGMSQM